MVTLKASSLPLWSVRETRRADFDVIDHHGAVVFANLPLEQAVIVASAPRLLRFVALFRQNSPAGLDIGRMLDLAGIIIEPEDADEPCLSA